jgi:uncharacterized protein YaaW (UPF0174 family)
MNNPHLEELRYLLSHASQDDLANLQKIVGCGNAPTPTLLCDHFNYLHGGLVGQAFIKRPYKQLVTDVADHVKIQWPGVLRGRTWDVVPSAEIEDAIVLAVVEKALASCSLKDREKLAEELGSMTGDPSLASELLAGGSMLLAKLSGFQIYMLATSAVGALTSGLGITLPFVFYTAMTTGIRVILGPIGWGALLVSALFSASRPNYSKLLPGVVYVSHIRHKLAEDLQ